MKKMIAKSMMAVFVLFLGFTACKTTKDTVASQKQSQLENTLLWKIEGKGIQSSYLFGTIHMIAKDDFFLNQPTKDAFDQCEQVVLELDMDDPSMAMEMMSNAAMADGMTIDKLVSAEEYQKVGDFVKSAIGADIGMFKAWQPILLTGIFATKFIDGPPSSYENTFVQMASKSNKEILGLETVKDQLGAMSKISYKDQAKMMLDVVNDLDAAKTMFADLVKAYKSQDVTNLHKMMIDQSGGVDFAASLLDPRNKDWIPKIGVLANKKSTFFAVGSGHLGGKNGVIQLLKNAGYTVSPIQN